jgi:hypothetical protein
MPGVILKLWRVDDHHVIRPGNLGHAPVQLAGWQRHNPEGERGLGQRKARVQGREIGPFQRTPRRISVNQEHTVTSPRENVGQPDRRGGLPRTWLEVRQSEAQTSHQRIIAAPGAFR